MKHGSGSLEGHSSLLLQESFLRTGSPLVLSITAEFLKGLQEAVGIGHDGGARALYRIGSCWGQAWFMRVEAHAQLHLKLDIRQMPLEQLQSLVARDLEALGWGTPRFDLGSHADRGVMLVVITGGPVIQLRGRLGDALAMLQAGYCAGILSALSELPIEGYGFRGKEGEVEVTHVVMTHESEIATVRTVWEESGDLRAVLKAVYGKDRE